MASRVKSPFSERWFGVTFWPEGRWWSQGRRWSPSPEQPQECWLLPASPPSPPPHAVSVHSQKDSPDALLVEAEVGNQTEQQVIVNIPGGGGLTYHMDERAVSSELQVRRRVEGLNLAAVDVCVCSFQIRQGDLHCAICSLTWALHLKHIPESVPVQIFKLFSLFVFVFNV